MLFFGFAEIRGLFLMSCARAHVLHLAPAWRLGYRQVVMHGDAGFFLSPASLFADLSQAASFSVVTERQRPIGFGQ